MRAWPILLAASSLAACQNANQVLDQQQAQATQAALSRGQFEMNCPTATADLLSRNLINPVLNGPVYAGVQRTEYTIGVSGCGQREVYIALCQVGAVSCVAAKSRS